MGYVVMSCVLGVLLFSLLFVVRHYGAKVEKLERRSRELEAEIAQWKLYAERLNALYSLAPSDAIDTVNKRLQDIARSRHPAPSSK